MVTEVYGRIQEGLEEKQKELLEFLETAPETEQEICLGSDGHCVQEHLHVIETSLEKIEDQSLGVCVVCHGYVDASLLEMDYTAAVCLDHYSEEERRRLESELGCGRARRPRHDRGGLRRTVARRSNARHRLRA